ncbi:MAG: hypothetical protein JHD07_12245 [Bradyrhizobium sp.]|uniref:hypothetical protein n=1 Tax=Bradyrhizobium sp. TaxID=376 RepID=UPI001A1A802F|nr:hypothetical protein [Bradyrhizobium sp.]MBJ7404010.1 hypothetical protein [Bradyrhizobium sp.]
MAQRETIPNGSSGAASQPPLWMHRAVSPAPNRRTEMLAHIARARSVPQHQAAATQPSARPRLAPGLAVLGDAYGYAILFGIIALLLQSLVPLYLGAFLFLSEGTRIENALGALGIRFDPDAVGPDIIKGFALCFAWLALLVSLRDQVPSWLVPWMPPAASWSLIAGIALALGIFDALAAAMIRRAGPWFGLAISPDGLICTMIKLAIAGGALALLVLLGAN